MASINEPIGGPYPVYVPTQIFQNHLPQTVAGARRFRGVITCAVAFDAKNRTDARAGGRFGRPSERPLRLEAVILSRMRSPVTCA